MRRVQPTQKKGTRQLRASHDAAGRDAVFDDPHLVSSGGQTAEELQSATDTVSIPADDIQAMTDLLQEQIRDRQHLVYVLARRLP